MNVIARLKYELAYNDSAVHRFDYYTTRTPPHTRICIHRHHHHLVPLARISLTLSRHFSLSFIASGRSSGLHPVSSHSCCMYVRAGRPAFAWPYAGVHRSTSLMSSSLLLQQCPACLVRLYSVLDSVAPNFLESGDNHTTSEFYHTLRHEVGN